ncbi:beta-ketoacyl synthase N-terminal-like domain-containing protein [Micromonospora echinaurantiaca]|uniref:beta-ketoacyl synthase N-terminal-like domain-containing protein n=1 Tax=Micromonospora echinaurantiaca TaxID=47857 RepID=UPI0037956740
MALIAASAVRSCFGDGAATFDRLLAGESGVGPLRHVDPTAVNVTHAHHLPAPAGADEPELPASDWLAGCVTAALAAAGLDPAAARVPVLVGTGLRELRSVERQAVSGRPVRAARLHFTGALRAAAPRLGPVLTVANACSASGHTLALAGDLVDSGAADVVVAAGTDAMTASMLAMIGRVTEEPTEQVRPFDADRTGVLLGEGAAAVVVVSGAWRGPVAARLLGVGLSCDAHHETAPSLAGISRAMTDALARAGRSPAEVDVVVSHGTGTLLNDVTEAEAIHRVLVEAGGDPYVTGIKGALGHTSGASALMSLDVAIRCLRDGRVPPVVGLRRPLPEATALRLVTGAPVRCAARVAQVNSFGFGGVNAVTLLAAA